MKKHYFLSIVMLNALIVFVPMYGMEIEAPIQISNPFKQTPKEIIATAKDLLTNTLLIETDALPEIKEKRILYANPLKTIKERLELAIQKPEQILIDTGRFTLERITSEEQGKITKIINEIKQAPISRPEKKNILVHLSTLGLPTDSNAKQRWLFDDERIVKAINALATKNISIKNMLETYNNSKTQKKLFTIESLTQADQPLTIEELTALKEQLIEYKKSQFTDKTEEDTQAINNIITRIDIKIIIDTYLEAQKNPKPLTKEYLIDVKKKLTQYRTSKPYIKETQQNTNIVKELDRIIREINEELSNATMQQELWEYSKGLPLTLENQVDIESPPVNTETTTIPDTNEQKNEVSSSNHSEQTTQSHKPIVPTKNQPIIPSTNEEQKRESILPNTESDNSNKPNVPKKINAIALDLAFRSLMKIAREQDRNPNLNHKIRNHIMTIGKNINLSNSADTTKLKDLLEQKTFFNDDLFSQVYNDTESTEDKDFFNKSWIKIFGSSPQKTIAPQDEQKEEPTIPAPNPVIIKDSVVVPLPTNPQQQQQDMPTIIQTSPSPSVLSGKDAQQIVQNLGAPQPQEPAQGIFARISNTVSSFVSAAKNSVYQLFSTIGSTIMSFFTGSNS